MSSRLMRILALFGCSILLTPALSAGSGLVNETISCGFNDDVLSENTGRSPHDTSRWFVWANGKIPYYFKGRVTNGDKKLFKDLMRKVERNTCFKFEERRREPRGEHHLEITVGSPSCSGSGFSAYVTPKSLTKILLHSQYQLTDSYRCDWGGGLLHELMHALGVGHTQKRADRDSYIRVLRDNIEDWSQYKVCKRCVVEPSIPYDCSSIMHYGTGTFSTGGPTMKAIDSYSCKLTRQGPAFTGSKQATQTDWKLLRLISSKVCSGGRAINGQWSRWGRYTSCDATCGKAKRTRERTCTNPPPSNGGRTCPGPDEESLKCNVPKCRCTGQNDGCCTRSKPCGVGEGDCDKDYHCQGNLVCGKNNCKWKSGFLGVGEDDCCKVKT